MKLDLREYTDPDQVAVHANGYIESWRFMKFLDDSDQLVGPFIEEEAEEHREWLVINVPWLVPYLDREIIYFLTGK